MNSTHSNIGNAAPEAPVREWACNRCMIAWDGGGGWCPYCQETATHGKAFDSTKGIPFPSSEEAQETLKKEGIDTTALKEWAQGKISEIRSRLKKPTS